VIEMSHQVTSEKVTYAANGTATSGQPVLVQPTISERGTGGAMFAAVLMIIGGFFGVLQGIAFIAKGSFYVQPANYWINTSATTWGWWLLIVGVVVAAAGFGVMSAAGWARWLGIVLVGIQALTNFMFIPVQPFWALTLVFVDLWIIYSLFVHRREPV
jgi:hypothetical protein